MRAIGSDGWLKFAPIWLFLMFYVLDQSSAAQAGTSAVPDANPGRPTVSTPAALTQVGYLQFENGTLFAGGSTEFSTRFGVSQTTKLAVHPRLELFLQSEPLAISTSEEQTSVHEGEVFAGVQGVLFPGTESKPTVSVGYIRRLHASVAPELDIGTFRQSASLLLSDDVHGFHVDLNGIIAEQAQEGIRRAQFGQTLSISHPVGKVIVSGEMWHFSQPFERSNAVGNLWALSYPVRHNLVIDRGFNHGLTETSTQWEVFVGFTYLLPHRLWSAPHNGHSPLVAHFFFIPLLQFFPSQNQSTAFIHFRIQVAKVGYLQLCV
jgi:hypothetical protein